MRPNEFERLSQRLGRHLGEDWTELNVHHLERRLTQKLDPAERIALGKKCAKLLRADERRQNEVLRVRLGKLLVALSASSDDLIASILRLRRTRLDYEVHFSVFCQMDGLLSVESAIDANTRMAILASDYLMTVDRNTAAAAWMAGDLLGDHLLPPDSLSQLCDVATKARFVWGRMGALHGLRMALKRRDSGRMNQGQREKVIETLRFVASDDRSLRARKTARNILSEIDPARRSVNRSPSVSREPSR